MLRHIQNSLGSVYRSNTATPQGQIIHHRNFQSQFDTTGNTLYKLLGLLIKCYQIQRWQ